MNPQSKGFVTLASSDPSDSPVIQPNLAQHAYDRRVIIEAMRGMKKLLEAPVFKKNTIEMVGGPQSWSDEDIWVCITLLALNCTN